MYVVYMYAHTHRYPCMDIGVKENSIPQHSKQLSLPKGPKH